VQEGRLAGAGRADQGRQRAGGEVEVDPLERLDLDAALDEAAPHAA
jgi:hypothetical protein